MQSKKSTHPTYWNYAWGMKYNAAGGLTEMQYGNGRWESMQYNERLQPTQIALGYTPNSTDQIKLNYSYNGSQNNGNVSTQTIEIFRKGLDPLKFYQEYQYDTLNRLKETKETDITSGGNTQTWKQVFDPDRYGNRMFGAGTTTLGNCPTNVCNPSFSQTNNRITSSPWNYDAAGNTTVDGNGQQFTYDSENKQVFVKNSSNTLLGEYFYDGDGKRVKKYVPATGETTIFVYDASGRTVAEYSTIVEPPTAAKVAYLTNDHLGSPRLNTDRDGNITSRHDYLPYGEEITVSLTPQRTDQGYTPDTVRKQFTGYERDDESGLDFAQARMFGSSLGRFTAVDPLAASATPSIPQSWNRYVYVKNSPLTRIDPTGMIDQYYNFRGELIGETSSGKKIWFAAETRRDEKSTWIDKNSRVETTMAEVERARIAAVPLKPGTGPDNAQLLVNELGARAPGSMQMIGVLASSSIIAGASIGGGAIAAGGAVFASEVAAAVILADMLISDAVEGSAPLAMTGGTQTLGPGPYAGESIEARDSSRNFTSEERRQINRIGQETGCHTCGTRNPGTITGNFVPDHQPANGLNPTGGPQRLFPHCLACSHLQGAQVRWYR